MLHDLAIDNLVIVERARLTIGPGLTVVSGETGAGKSLLLDALGLLAGGRASTGMVGPAGEAAQVTGVLSGPDELLATAADACGVAADDGRYVLRRRLTASGRSQAWINDVPVTVTALAAVGRLLLRVHGQDDARRLAEPAAQLDLLDGFGRHRELATAWSVAHQAVLDTERRLHEIEAGARDSLREREFIEFQLQEFTALQPIAGELAGLEERIALLAEADRWIALAAEVATQADHDGPLRQLRRAARQLQGAPEARLRGVGDELHGALQVIDEAAARLADAGQLLTPEPGERQRVEARLDAWYGLQRKHGDGETAVLDAWTALQADLTRLAGLDDERSMLAARLVERRAAREQAGGRLVAARTRAGDGLLVEVHRHLADLGMAAAKVRLAVGPDQPGPLGPCAMSFEVCTNPGLPWGALGDIASGGEASRLLLAMASAVGAATATGVLVFDEVDSGVGGRLGAAIAGKLAALGKGRTVLAVTHTPQIAAAADRHYVVRKRQGAGSTVVTVTLIEGGERQAELAEMLGGGKAAMRQAAALLEARAG